MASKPKITELNVSVEVKRGDCRRIMTVDISRMKLPTTLSLEGLVVEVRKNGTTGNGRQIDPDPNRIRGSGTKRKRTVEITLPDKLTANIPTWKKYPLIPIPTDVRPFFPPYGRDFIIRCNGLEITTHVTNAHNGDTDPMRGKYIRAQVGKLWNANPSVKPGDKLVFTKLAQKQDGKTVYQMDIKP